MRDEYFIETSRKACRECGRQFDPAEEYVSAVFEVPTSPEHPHGMARMDFCQQHWPANRPEYLAFWMTRAPVPEVPAKRPLVIDDARLLDVFFRLKDIEDPAKLDLRYVVGLMLIRRRRLKVEGTRRRGDHSFMLVRKSRDKEIHELLDRPLSDEAIAAVSREIGSLMDLVDLDTLEDSSDES
jgi:hypothetical protein